MYRQMKRIDVLPDDVLLEIFGFYMKIYPPYGDKTEMEAWQSLVHVCRRDTLDIWPALPLIIEGYMALTRPSGTDNIIAALGQSNRVCQVFLSGLTRITCWPLEEVLAAMQVQFPELTDLQLFSDDETSPVILDSFLDGSAPRMRLFELCGISFPGLPKLLLSATHLVYLALINIPHSGYISPEAIVALLSGLPSLRALTLEFRSPQSRPDSESPSLPPPKRSIFPALDEFRFKGVTEYIEELMTRIDTPRLDRMYITFFNQIDFDCTRLVQFINRTPKHRSRDEAQVRFDDSTASLTLRYLTPRFDFDELRINISCREPDWQLSSIEQVCNSLPPLSTVEDLYIDHEYSQLVWKSHAVENTL